MRYLIIGAGLVGEKVAQELAKQNEVELIDPYKHIEIEGVLFKREEFNEFSKNPKNQNRFDSILNFAYPMKRDREIETFPEPGLFNTIISSHLGFYYEVMYMSKFLLHNQSGSVLSAASIYSLFMPRNEIYLNSRLITPVDYIAVKSSLIYMTKYFAKNYSKNIYFNTISFGGVYNNHEETFNDTYGKYTKSGSMLNIQDLIKSIIFLARSQELKINGENLIVDDGFTL